MCIKWNDREFQMSNFSFWSL